MTTSTGMGSNALGIVTQSSFVYVIAVFCIEDLGRLEENLACLRMVVNRPMVILRHREK